MSKPKSTDLSIAERRASSTACGAPQSMAVRAMQRLEAEAERHRRRRRNVRPKPAPCLRGAGRSNSRPYPARQDHDPNRGRVFRVTSES